MPETLLSPSQVKLYGREFKGFRFERPSAADVDPNPGTTAKSSADSKEPVPDAGFDLLTNQLLRDGARFARIYGFTYEGNYYALPRPAVFLIHGPGRDVEPRLGSSGRQFGEAGRILTSGMLSVADLHVPWIVRDGGPNAS